MSGAGTLARNQSAEERYLAKLESARSTWWSSGNFDTWKRLYAGEYPRGFLIMDTLRRYVPEFRVQGAHVLDIGCGDAGAIIAFAEHGAVCAGIECFEASLERGKIRASDHGVDVDLRKGVAESIPYPDATFDLVMLDNVLEHVNDRPLTLREVRRVLKPGGLLIIQGYTPKQLQYGTGGPKQLVWASDWPFIGFEDTITYAMCVDRICQWLPDDATRRQVLVETPAKLFRFQ